MPETDSFHQAPEKWHAIDVSKVLSRLATSDTRGLSSEAARRNLEKYGANILAKIVPRSNWRIFLGQFTSIPVALLAAAAVLSGATGGLADALTILGVVGINAAIGYLTESESEKIVQGLRPSENLQAIAIRDGREIALPVEEIVPGDILVLRAGCYVPADARLLAGTNLCLDESMLTGESVPANKSPAVLLEETVALADRANMLFQGTFIASGQGLAAVVATGQATEMGQIATLLGESAVTQTPLQKQLDRAGGQLAAVSGGVCLLVFGLGLLHEYSWLEMMKTAIALAVAAVPEGLPAVATTTLALGIREMRQRHIIVRGLSAVEALGSVQTICLDKTGTLTQNRMVIREIDIGDKVFEFERNQLNDGESDLRVLIDSEERRQLPLVALLCNECDIERTPAGEWQVRGSPTEVALIDLAIASGMDLLSLRRQYPRLAVFPRAVSCNWMSTIHALPDDRAFVALKGNPQDVLNRCKTQMRAGEAVPLSNREREEILLSNERMAGKALRVLGCACGFRDNWKPEDSSDREAIERDLVWLGLAGMTDPIREGVPELVEEFYRAGITPVMLTGDQRPTAYAIGKQIHLNRDRELEILDSADISQIELEKLQAICNKVNIFARISPADKLQVVKAMQAAGKIVAMTGDGINDAPALKCADIGVAMGSGKAEIVREVADAIVEDDNLGTLIDAIRQGRTIYSNIRKSVHFLLATNFGEIAVMTAATSLGLGAPLNAMQLLWLNLVTDIFPGLALALEPPEPDVLDRPPRDPDRPILGRDDYLRIVSEGIVISLSAMAAYIYALVKYGQSPQASTVAFMSLTIAQILHTYGCRSDTHSLFDTSKLPDNPYVTAAVAGTLALQVLPLILPGLKGLLDLAAIGLADSLVIAVAAIAPLLLNEVTKYFGPSLQK